jgi:hypothetical protein
VTTLTAAVDAECVHRLIASPVCAAAVAVVQDVHENRASACMAVTVPLMGVAAEAEVEAAAEAEVEVEVEVVAVAVAVM